MALMDLQHTPKLLRRIVMIGVILFAAMTMTACTEDEDPGDRELTLYVLACPTGPFVCYNDCFVANDTDGSGTIQGSEFFTYNLCNQSCNSRCSLAFLFYYLVDE